MRTLLFRDTILLCFLLFGHPKRRIKHPFLIADKIRTGCIAKGISPDCVLVGSDERILNYHQGGPTGYGCREFTVTPETKGVIKKNQAYAWNPTIAGTKCEDTTFLADNGVEIFTRTKAWPCTVIETEYGSCSVADILYIKNE